MVELNNIVLQEKLQLLFPFLPVCNRCEVPQENWV
jgi:hypothetical protein